MLSSVVTALLLASSASRVAAGPLEMRHNHKHLARGYAQDADILEDYSPYHVRYLALDCQDKHNTTFFDKCCHPLLRWQKLSDRPKECIPSPAASSSAAAVEPTAAPIDEDPIDDECDPEDDPEEEDCDDETTTHAPTSTKAPVTQAPVTTSYKAPEPTSTKEAHSEEPVTTHSPSSTRMVTSTVRTSSAEPTTSSTPDDGNNGGQTITGGTATFYKQNGGTGACGQKHGDDDLIVAMDYRMYGDENSRSKYCGKTVRITNKKTGKQADAIVADCCPTCVSKGSLDMSTGLFYRLGGTAEEGVFPIAYTIMD